MGCSSCQNIKTIEEARINAQKMAKACQTNFVIYKKYIHGIGYSYGYSEQGRKLEKWCSEVEVIQFQQPESEVILSDNGGEEPVIVVPEETVTRTVKRKPAKATD